MPHNASARADSGTNGMTRIGSLRITLAVTAFAALPAILIAGPIPGLPDLRSPPSPPQPPPSPSRQPQPQLPRPTGQHPYAYSGPVGRLRLSGVWGYRADPGDVG